MIPFEKPDLVNEYSYIIVGAGLAGLSLALELISRANANGSKLLLIDRSFSNYSERTWCFWDEGEDVNEDLIVKEWNDIELHLPDKSLDLRLGKYSYKMMNSTGFRNRAFKILDKAIEVELLVASVSEVLSYSEGGAVYTDKGVYGGSFIFDSRMDVRVLENHPGNILWQQFKGWYIETDTSVFDPSKATLMDFRVEQPGAVAFYYVLPLHAKKALVEYTLFTTELKSRQFYEDGLRMYLDSRLGAGHYRIVSAEEGVIPMTDYTFDHGRNRVIPIGTAAGWTKPSTGYTYTFVRKEVRRMVNDLEEGNSPSGAPEYFKTRFWFYDRILLRLLSRYPERGAGIFFSLFNKNPPQRVFRFLDNKTSFGEELRIFMKLPVIMFVRMALVEIFKRKSR